MPSFGPEMGCAARALIAHTQTPTHLNASRNAVKTERELVT